jgi:hypothetical protein
MQLHLCVICKLDSFGGGSLVHEGMFFKLCKDCMEEEENVRLLNEALTKEMEEDGQEAR